jgi:Transposase DDE domain
VIRRVRAFAARQLAGYLQAPGDGRVAPVVPAAALLWSVLAAYLLREGAFHAIEALVRSRARRALGVPRPFGDDTLAYFTERLAVAPTRAALVRVVRQAKRRKAFDDVWLVGLVLDGTTVGRCPTVRCPFCHPVIVPHLNAAGLATTVGTVVGQQHKLSLLAVVGGELVLPVDLEPYGPGDSEQGASLRVLDRGLTALGRRFAQYVVGDSLYASAPFLHAVGDRGLHAVVRLKANLPTLYTAARARFEGTAPTLTVEERGARVELWDADDFDPWADLRWSTVRVLRYRQHHRDGTIVEAYWLTDFSARRVSTRTLYRLAKGRWTIENQGFNDGKTRYGLDHVPHHEANSLLIHWLCVAMTLTLERLYRLRYLRRGTHPPVSAITLVRRLRLSLGQPILESG